MNRPTDETLVAYADGMLPAAEAEAVEVYLAGDEEMRRFVAALKASAALTQQAFEAPMHEPSLRSVAGMIMAAPPHGAQRASVANMPSKASMRPQRSTWQPMAIAASLALVVGLAAGALLANRTGNISGSQLALGAVDPASALHGILERHSSGEAIALPPNSGRQPQRLAMVATFRDRLERMCREFELVTATPDLRPLAAGVACRATDGRWILEGATRVAAPGPATSTGSETFYPSGIREKDAMEGLLNLLGAGKSLSPAEERDLIARSWKN